MSQEELGALKAQMVLVLASIQELKTLLAPQQAELAELRADLRMHKLLTRLLIGLSIAVSAGAVTVNSSVLKLLGG